MGRKLAVECAAAQFFVVFQSKLDCKMGEESSRCPFILVAAKGLRGLVLSLFPMGWNSSEGKASQCRNLKKI